MRRKKPGVYKIVNVTTGMLYVGSSIDMDHRIRAHLSNLRRGNHPNPHLQHSWNVHGSSNFIFQIIEIVEDFENLAERETHYIVANESNNPKKGFNVAPVGGTTRGIKLPPFSDEHRRKIGAAHVGRQFSEEARRKMSASRMGKTISEAHKMTLARIAAERVHTDETRRKLSIAAASISDETRAKRRAAMLKTITPERLQAMDKHGKNITDETRKKRAESLKAYWDAVKRGEIDRSSKAKSPRTQRT